LSAAAILPYPEQLSPEAAELLPALAQAGDARSVGEIVAAFLATHAGEPTVQEVIDSFLADQTGELKGAVSGVQGLSVGQLSGRGGTAFWR
jgi:hypothetical protein